MTARPSWYGDPSPAQYRALSKLAALPADDRFTTALASQAGGGLVSAIIPPTTGARSIPQTGWPTIPCTGR